MPGDDVRRFVIDVPEPALVDLRQRLGRTRWPEAETGDGWVQGVPLEYLRRLCRYWATGYDWRTAETRLTRLPHFVTTVDGLDIHFVHLRSTRPGAVPVVLTHGWPGSFLEFERALALLTDPAFDGPAFDLVVPSLPGYGFSGRPSRAGWDVHRIARAWSTLMHRLGYRRFLAAGSDWGTSVSTSIALQRPDSLLGLHLVPPLAPPERSAPDLTDAERAALAELDERTSTGSGYSAMQGTRPQTIGYSLLDSPAGLCAWLVEKIWEWADHDGDLATVLSDDQVLDNVSLYWLTGTGASSARLYWESIAQVTEWFSRTSGEPITVATGASVFPKEVPRPSRRWAQRRFPNIVHWGEPRHGGHFAAWEQPELFVDELTAVARALRAG